MMGKLPAVIGGLACMAAGFWLTGPANAAGDPSCKWAGASHYYRLSSRGPWPRYFSMRSGATCSSRYRDFSSPGGRVVIRLHKLTLWTPPAHGAVTLHENASADYSATKGYVGPDKFELEVCGEENGTSGCTLLEYNVTINPG